MYVFPGSKLSQLVQSDYLSKVYDIMHSVCIAIVN